MDRATEEFDVFAHHRKSHAAAFHLVSGTEGLKHFKYLLVEPGGDTGTVVFDGERVIGAAIFDAYLNAPLLLIVMLDRVADQVHQDLLQRHGPNVNGGET